MFNHNDVIAAVGIAEEVAEAVVGNVGVGKRGAGFGVEVADAN